MLKRVRERGMCNQISNIFCFHENTESYLLLFLLYFTNLCALNVFKDFSLLFKTIICIPHGICLSKVTMETTKQCKESVQN